MHLPVAFYLVHTGIEPALPCHLKKIYILCNHCLHDLGLYIWEILTNTEIVIFQKLDFLRIFFINWVTTEARELRRISQIGLDPIIQNIEMRES